LGVSPRIEISSVIGRSGCREHAASNPSGTTHGHRSAIAGQSGARSRTRKVT
jgi:hypothetical protein